MRVAGNLDVLGNELKDSVVESVSLLSQTHLLLHCDGTDGSTSFSDASLTPTSVTTTIHGNVQVDTDQKVFGTGSALFDGSSYLSVPTSEDFIFHTSNFTVDFRVRWNGTPGATDFMGVGGPGGNLKWIIGWNTTIAGANYLYFNSTYGTVSWSWEPVADTWYHLAIVRSGNSWYAFVDGTILGSPQTQSVDIVARDYLGLIIGADGELWKYFTGWLDEVRISKGIARWTSNFTSPAAEYVWDEYTKLLLHCDYNGSSMLFPDSSSSSHVVTAHSDAKVVITQKKFGNGSVYFDENLDDYLSTPADSDFDFGDGDFTTELWVRLASIPSGWWGLLGCNNVYTNWGIMFHPSFHGSNLHITFANPGYQRLEYAWSPLVDQWYHIALVRNGADLKVFVDGTQLGSTYDLSTTTIAFTSDDYLGVNHASGGPANCWVDEIRVSKGIARWTSNFMLPVSEYVSDEYTTLLLHCNETSLFPESSPVSVGKVVSACGDVQVDTDYKKFGTGAAKFVRNNCYLTIPDNQDFDFLDDDFTVDFWVYLTSTDNYQTVFARDNGAFTGDWPSWMIRNVGSTMYFEATSAGGGWDIADKSMGTISLNTWTHYAVVRSGINFYTFKNGVQVNTWTSSLAIHDSSGQAIIGHDRDTGACITGWLDELRVCKGIAWWTSDFILPVRPYTVPNQGQLGFLTTDGRLYCYSGTAWREESFASTFVGTIIAWTTATPPTGFLECDGSVLDRATYADLFAVIGTAYGNTDETDFRLPDYRGYFHRSWAHSSANDPDRAARSDRGDGVVGDQVGTKQSDEFESHNHDSVEDLVEDIWGYYSPLTSGWIDNLPYPDGWGYGVDVGGDETRPKNVNVMYCIKY